MNTVSNFAFKCYSSSPNCGGRNIWLVRWSDHTCVDKEIKF